MMGGQLERAAETAETQRLLLPDRGAELRKLADSLINAAAPPPSLSEMLSKLERISYREHVGDILQSKSEERFSRAAVCLRRLWVDQFGLADAFKILDMYRNFEPILYRDFSYRDHFIHQFYVFLCGLPIVDQTYDSAREAIARSTGCDQRFVHPEESWLFAATFHDVGYPLERIHSWLATFFRDLMGISEPPITIDMTRTLLATDYLRTMAEISSLCAHVYDGTPRAGGDVYAIEKFFLEKFLGELNHGLVSALIFVDKSELQLEYMEEGQRNRHRGVVLPAALAIALHDIVREQDRQGLFEPILFEADPLTACLLFCDALQDFGRPSQSQGEVGYCPSLTDYHVTGDRVSATLTYPVIETITLGGVTTTTFDRKKEEIAGLFRKLKSDKPVFEITLRCQDDDYDREEVVMSSANT